MGGYGSGRRDGGPTVGDALALDLPKLLRDRLFRPGQGCQGSLVWTNTATGQHVASIGYQTIMGQEQGRARLTYTTTRHTGERHERDYWLTLTTTPQPIGGRRWWWLCPLTRRRVAKLYLPPGALTFASRQAYGLAYASQRETASDRAIRRAHKRRDRLGGTGGFGLHIRKPKRMRWATYGRALEQVRAAEAECNAHMMALLQRLKGQGVW